MKNYKSVMAARVILIFQMMQAVLRFPTSTKASPCLLWLHLFSANRSWKCESKSWFCYPCTATAHTAQKIQVMKAFACVSPNIQFEVCCGRMSRASCSGNSSLFGVNKGGRLVFTTVLSVESAFNTPAKCPGQKHHRSDDYQQGCSQNKNTQKPDGSFWKHTKKWHFFYVCSLLGPHNFFSAHFFHKYDQTMTFVFPNVTY